MRVRLWQPWLGPDGWVPSGEEVEVAPEVAAALGQAGHAEAVGQEVAALAVSEHAIRIPSTRPGRRKAKGKGRR